MPYLLPTEMNRATLNWVTPDGDNVIAFVARMSSPKNQKRMQELSEQLDNPEAVKELRELTAGLMKFCAENGHVSIFEQAHMSLFIRTSRAISPQLFRHHSFRFQEFSQRYATVPAWDEIPDMRPINPSGRKRDPSVVRLYYEDSIDGTAEDSINDSYESYQKLLDEGVHPESARMVLPLATPTVLTMTGNMRDWIFFLKNRLSPHAQREVQTIALYAKTIMAKEYPILYSAIEEILPC